MKNLLIIMAFLGQLLAQPSLAADYAREKKWADEVVPGIVVGDPVYLKQANQHEFLTLYTPARDAKAAIILVHGKGVQPDWGFIGVQRSSLADIGFTTLSIQMPVLRNEASDSDYRSTLPEARERLELAVDFLKSKGYAEIAIESHSLGSWMTYDYLTHKPDPSIKAWVNLGIGADVDFTRLKLAILDLLGEKDLPAVQKFASKRKKALAGIPGSTQIVIAGADHFYTDQQTELFETIKQYLGETFK